MMKLIRVGSDAFELEHLCAAESADGVLRLHVDFQDDPSKLAVVMIADTRVIEALWKRLHAHPDFYITQEWAVHRSRVCRARLDNSVLQLVFWFGSTSHGRARHLQIEGPAAPPHFQALGEEI
jgi:hypothetical protein